jgi:hypothetical protein
MTIDYRAETEISVDGKALKKSGINALSATCPLEDKR